MCGICTSCAYLILRLSTKMQWELDKKETEWVKSVSITMIDSDLKSKRTLKISIFLMAVLFTIIKWREIENQNRAAIFSLWSQIYPLNYLPFRRQRMPRQNEMHWSLQIIKTINLYSHIITNHQSIPHSIFLTFFSDFSVAVLLNMCRA